MRGETYEQFLAKFEPKKTTDDCYTPECIYDVVAQWACRRYGLDRSRIVRPFWPGGDYESYEYPEGCVVVDNPPFSILSKIIRFFHARGIRFFLFAPGLTLFACASEGIANYVVAAVAITYENGATVRTSFVTSEGENLIEVVPELYDAVEAANAENVSKTKKHLDKLQFPIAVATAARLNWLAVHGTPYAVKRGDAVFVRSLDAMGKRGIFGGAFLLSERAAAERAAAERAAAERAAAERAAAERAAAKRAAAVCYGLSERETEIQKRLSK